MRIIITGTPGTGKTSVANRLSQIIKKEVVHLNDLIINKKLYTEYDKERESYIVSIERLKEECKKKDDVIIEGHLSHYCMRDGDTIIVLRCNPQVLRKRLKNKKYPLKKIDENIEAEVIDVILQETLSRADDRSIKVYEIDTSDKIIDKIAIIIKKIMEDERYAKNYLPGNIDFTQYILDGKI